jgi:hypothetical protein
MPERAGEERRCTLTVDVVIAMHQNTAAGTYHCSDGLDRLGHTGECVGIREIAQRGPEITAGRLLAMVAPLDQQRSQCGGKPEPGGELLDDDGIRRRSNHPAEEREGRDAHHFRIRHGGHSL